MSDEQDAHAHAIIESFAADNAKLIADLNQTVDAAAVQTAANLHVCVAHLDALIVDINNRINALERAYVAGSSEAPAGSPATRERIEQGRVLLELTRDARERLSEIAAEMEHKIALGQPSG